MDEPKLRLGKSGATVTTRSAPVKTIVATAKARESYVRVIIVGLILSLLTVAYIVALFMKVEGAQSILVIIGSGVGFLLGGDGRSVKRDE